MIILEIIIFVIMLLMIISSYWKLTELDKYNTELEDRMLQFEKRIEDLKRDKIKCHNWILNELNERLNETSKLDLRLQKLERKKKSDK